MNDQLPGIGGLAADTADLDQKKYACPACKTANKVWASGRSVSSVCDSCRALVDIRSLANPVLIESGKKDMKAIPLLPIGASCTLTGTNWRVIGFIQRIADGQYETSEYLLYNRIAGFRWLAHFDGNWTIVSKADGVPQVGADRRAKFKGKTFELDEEGSSVISSLLGEFYWTPGVGDKVAYMDYYDGEDLLCLERDAEEDVWSTGGTIDASTINGAFGGRVKIATPRRPFFAKSGADLSTTLAHSGPGLLWWLGFVGVMLFIQLYSVFAAKNDVVFSRDFELEAIDRAPSGAPLQSTLPMTVVTEPFDLKGGLGNLRIDFGAKVDNSWVEFDGVLVEKETGVAREFEQVVEYYHGVDQGEAWSEGAQNKDVVLSSVPDGTYLISLKVAGEGRKAQVLTPNIVRFTMRATRDVPMWGNFMLALFAVSVLPGLLLIRIASALNVE